VAAGAVEDVAGKIIVHAGLVRVDRDEHAAPADAVLVVAGVLVADAMLLERARKAADGGPGERPRRDCAAGDAERFGQRARRRG
jgi:hypothetical protein